MLGLNVYNVASTMLLASTCVAQTLPQVLPLDQIFTNNTAPAITETFDTYATYYFQSSIPVACAVVYGEDNTTFGMIANDPAMTTTATIEHNVVLSDLKPDTVYYFRSQGSDANGNIYADVIRSFRSEPETESDAFNIAALSNGASVKAVSSNYADVSNSELYGADEALDEDPVTAWSSNGDGDNAFIEVLLSEEASPTSVGVWSRSMTDGTAIINSVNITMIQADGTSKTFGPFDLPTTTQEYQFDVACEDTLIQSVRVDVVESTGGNTGLVNLAVYV
ncbi:hypothetical protein SARC_08995 [Sphaeroforma arctica JP610]|uniref:F5/8 type C domain-containing protein n=1 Tax=Sphaeroforma arctica JP610 TaxID=667725 RepID=A0A0L0FRI7_9EUKA|nr:hypothetical protein SARC_08995 [Sphaeroforma arctica JP610]KNC78578.1 hypothetical protein SARC_08995 [Sphaeroforma arctica JP610]|eukprot:XP_014152480.1 hypothetical protein SARC_08995 [Sphaeroforma arctica JP610]